MYTHRWGKNLFSFTAVSALLSSFGALWLVVKITAFFFADTKAPEIIRGLWYVFGGVGVGIAAYRCWPRFSVSHRLNGRDTIIQIAIGDVFAFSGAVVVGTNTTFDTHISRDLISERSVQGAFTRKYYGDETQLDAELVSALADELSTPITGHRMGKSNAYPMGTVARLTPRERTAYLVAIADINAYGVASGTFDGLKDALAQLWLFIGSRGLKEDVVLPVLGTGFCRLTQTREEIVRETVRSFVAACSERTFCSKLTIVLSPRDVAEHCISLDEIGIFVRHVCTYTEFASNAGAPVGTAA